MKRTCYRLSVRKQKVYPYLYTKDVFTKKAPTKIIRINFLVTSFSHFNNVFKNQNINQQSNP